MEDLQKKGKFEELKKEEGYCLDDFTNFILPGSALLIMIGSAMGAIWYWNNRK